MPHVRDRVIDDIVIRDARLRWPVDRALPKLLRGKRIGDIRRRGKYLLIDVADGSLLVHLGMSGSLRVVAPTDPPARHDHIDLLLDSRAIVRFNDPRRFGSFHFARNPETHPLLARLGPEPLDAGFDGAHLTAAARGRRVAIKNLIMNAQVVVGVGNIYANEALFLAGIHPQRAAGRISSARLDRLTGCVRDVLNAAIASGGTTLRDFVGSDGRPGYFRQSLAVYERAGAPCRRCGASIRRRVIGQRASYYCPQCQR